MAYAFTQYDNIPLAADLVMPYPLDAADYWFSGRMHYDDTWPSLEGRPVVMYLHGDGREDHYDDSEAIVTEVISRGYVLFTLHNFESGTSSGRYEISGYGNTQSPGYYGRMIRGAWWCQAGLEFVPTLFTGTPDIYLFGQSMGAFSVTAWSALSDGPFAADKDLVKGIMTNGGLAGGGLGNYTWNSEDRSWAHFTPFFQQLKHTTFAMWATNDEFAPPDMVRRWQMLLPSDSDVLVYVISPGAQPEGHAWIAESSVSFIWGAWLDSLIAGTAPIVDGTEAIPGPAAEVLVTNSGGCCNGWC